jgi:hypothetical protein
MRSKLPLLVVLLSFAASAGVIAANTSSSGGGGPAVSSGGGSGHSGGGSGGGGHSGEGHSGAFHGGGAENLGRGSFSHVLGNSHVPGNHTAVPIAAKNAIVSHTAPTKPGHKPDHKPDHHYPAFRHVSGREMSALFGYCAAATYDLYNPANRYGFHCGGAIKAPINPQTGQPVG